MEWIFFVTKPSFMSGMSIWSQIRIYLLAALGISVLPLLMIVLLSLLARVFTGRSMMTLLTTAGIAIPTLIFSSLVLMMVDNFTYTVFKFGIVSTERIPRALYGMLFLLLCAFVFYRMNLYVQTRSTKKARVRRSQRKSVSVILLFSVLLSIFTFSTDQNRGLAIANIAQGKRLPNIVLLGSDGLDATHLAVYGYERDTTPQMKGRLASALVAENAFSNGGTTAGSVASILTGKLPIESRVIYPPDILTGEDSYQHLPGILKRLGYQTVDLSVAYFGDALTLNMQGGFDIAKQRSGKDRPVVRITRFLGGGDSAYFVDTMMQRISDRLLHIFFLKPMVNPYEAVIKPADRENEQKRFDELIAALHNSDKPVFVHVHMLGTHGPRFEVRQQVFFHRSGSEPGLDDGFL